MSMPPVSSLSPAPSPAAVPLARPPSALATEETSWRLCGTGRLQLLDRGREWLGLDLPAGLLATPFDRATPAHRISEPVSVLASMQSLQLESGSVVITARGPDRAGGAEIDWELRAERIEPRFLALRMRARLGDGGLPAGLRRVRLNFAFPVCAADTFTVRAPLARIPGEVPLAAFLAHAPGHRASADDLLPDLALRALDTGPGLLVLTRSGHSLAVQLSPVQGPAFLRLHAYAGEPRLQIDFDCEARLGPEAWVELGTVEFSRLPTDGRVAALGRRLAASGLRPPTDRPAWVRDAVIYEADLLGEGGATGLKARLPDLRALGYDTLYLMPWHAGKWSGYGTEHYLRMDPAKGSFAELRALTDEAHALGMRVLFDLLTSMVGEDSPHLAENPDWLYRDDEGRVVPHSMWPGPSLDPASPALRAFFRDYAVRCAHDWGADGFRCDAVMHRAGNWFSPAGLQPRAHSAALFSLLADVRTAMREANPDAAFLAECFGPEQVPVSDLVGFQWIGWLDWCLHHLCLGALDGRTLALLLRDHFDTLAPDTLLALYTHTHDTVAFQKREIDAPVIDAFFAALCFLGAAVMTFGGGSWDMRRRPQDDAEKEFLATIYAAKHRLGGVAVGEVEFDLSADARLLVARRPSRSGEVRIVANLSADFVTAGLGAGVIYRRHPGAPADRLAPHDVVVVFD